MKIRLEEPDRERYGCPEWLDCSIDPLSVRDAEALEDATGMEPLEALKLMVPAREKLDDTKVRFRWKPRGLRLLVWLGLHRANVHVKFDDLTFSYRPFLGSEVVDDVSPGKDDSSSGDEPTPSTSVTSSPPTKSKTSKT